MLKDNTDVFLWHLNKNEITAGFSGYVQKVHSQFYHQKIDWLATNLLT